MDSVVRDAMRLGLRIGDLAARRGIDGESLLRQVIILAETDTDLGKLTYVLRMLERGGD